MNRELNECVANAIGWSKRADGEWLNYWGAPVNELPDFSGNESDAQTVIRHFEPSLQTRIDGRHDKFYSNYHEGMTPEEVCHLAIKVMTQTGERS